MHTKGSDKMLAEISEKLSKYLVKKDVVELERQEVYTYGFNLIISTGFSVVTVLLISSLLINFFAGVAFLVVMMSIRFFCGGYHCSMYLKCWLVTNGIAFFTFLVIRIIPQNSFLVSAVMLIISLLSAAFIFVCSPVENSNNPHSEKTRQKNKHISYVFTAIYLAFEIFGFIFFRQTNIFTLFSAISAALAVVAILLLAEIVKRRCKYGNS